MISERDKARAIAKMRHNIPLNHISTEFEIPLPLLKEWKNNLSLHDLTAIEANIHAVEELTNGELVPLNEDILKIKLEETAIELAKEASLVGPDVVHAKAVQLCSDAIVKLYTTIVLKGGTVQEQSSGSSRSFFTELMKD